VIDATVLVRTVFGGLSALVIEDVNDAGESIVVAARTRDGTVECPGCGVSTRRRKCDRAPLIGQTCARLLATGVCNAVTLMGLIGTPAGVGKIDHDDRVECEVEGLNVLANPVLRC
jgi:hypothetical protein